MQDILNFRISPRTKENWKKLYIWFCKYNAFDKAFNPVTYEEYEYNGKGYICVKANSDFDGVFSNFQMVLNIVMVISFG